jgi:hypothetical protein
MHPTRFIMQTNMCNASFYSSCATHSIDSTEKKWLLRAGYESAKGEHFVETACIFADCSTTTNQQTSSLHHHQSTKQVCFGNQRMLAEFLLWHVCYASSTPDWLHRTLKARTLLKWLTCKPYILNSEPADNILRSIPWDESKSNSPAKNRQRRGTFVAHDSDEAMNAWQWWLWLTKDDSWCQRWWQWWQGDSGTPDIGHIFSRNFWR